MTEGREGFDEAVLIPACIALWTEKDRALVIVHPMHGEAEFPGEVGADFGADQARGACDEECFVFILH